MFPPHISNIFATFCLLRSYCQDEAPGRYTVGLVVELSHCSSKCLWSFTWAAKFAQRTSVFCEISAECELETRAINQTTRLFFPSAAHRSLPSSPFPSLITHTLTVHTTHTHPPTGFHSLCFPFDFICCSRSVLIYLCGFTSHSDNLLSCLSASCLSLLILCSLVPISVFLMASFEVRTMVKFCFSWLLLHVIFKRMSVVPGVVLRCEICASLR